MKSSPPAPEDDLEFEVDDGAEFEFEDDFFEDAQISVSGDGDLRDLVDVFENVVHGTGFTAEAPQEALWDPGTPEEARELWGKGWDILAVLASVDASNPAPPTVALPESLVPWPIWRVGAVAACAGVMLLFLGVISSIALYGREAPAAPEVATPTVPELAPSSDPVLVGAVEEVVETAIEETEPKAVAVARPRPAPRPAPVAAPVAVTAPDPVAAPVVERKKKKRLFGKRKRKRDK